ncbi:hypothetical protein FF011L_26890 [Roseimaritima multifibrata]|uniref:Uncharacterized protein n=2 Tax=Roseimaritima multifibrata TaxID=1930274 RepID=A0A517MGA4_9BACT|nr:hypothetical protein FF011L_26890 [Roseimaritima multifibrata]
MDYPTTPDGRYFVVAGRLWRKSDPRLSEAVLGRLVRDLMSARRAVKAAKRSGDNLSLEEARRDVDAAKVALGERGPTWWNDDTDFNRHLASNTPYADWWAEESKRSLRPESST